MDESIRKCRSLSHELSPPILHQSGFLAALEWLAGDMEAKHGFRVSLETRNEAEPDSPTLASMLFRSVRELLFNAVKHSGTDRAAVEARGEGDSIYVRVEDEGKIPGAIRQERFDIGRQQIDLDDRGFMDNRNISEGSRL